MINTTKKCDYDVINYDHFKREREREREREFSIESAFTDAFKSHFTNDSCWS